MIHHLPFIILYLYAGFSTVMMMWIFGRYHNDPPPWTLWLLIPICWPVLVPAIVLATGIDGVSKWATSLPARQPGQPNLVRRLWRWLFGPLS